MHIDKASFLLALGTIAAGGVGGYVVRDRNLIKAPPLPLGAAEPQPASGGTAAGNETAAPACDDMVGAPGACPPLSYPAEEGGCGKFPTKRCDDFKQTMKPRVAEQAVACLNSLTPVERCDPNRVSLCAHAALMKACAPTDSSVGGVTRSVDDIDVDARCSAVVQGCAGTSIAPTMRECRATIAGLSAIGRDQLVACA